MSTAARVRCRCGTRGASSLSWQLADTDPVEPVLAGTCTLHLQKHDTEEKMSCAATFLTAPRIQSDAVTIPSLPTVTLSRIAHPLIFPRAHTQIHQSWTMPCRKGSSATATRVCERATRVNFTHRGLRDRVTTVLGPLATHDAQRLELLLVVVIVRRLRRNGSATPPRAFCSRFPWWWWHRGVCLPRHHSGWVFLFSSGARIGSYRLLYDNLSAQL